MMALIYICHIFIAPVKVIAYIIRFVAQQTQLRLHIADRNRT